MMSLESHLRCRETWLKCFGLRDLTPASDSLSPKKMLQYRCHLVRVPCTLYSLSMRCGWADVVERRAIKLLETGSRGHCRAAAVTHDTSTTSVAGISRSDEAESCYTVEGKHNAGHVPCGPLRSTIIPSRRHSAPSPPRRLLSIHRAAAAAAIPAESEFSCSDFNGASACPHDFTSAGVVGAYKEPVASFGDEKWDFCDGLPTAARDRSRPETPSRVPWFCTIVRAPVRSNCVSFECRPA